MITILRYPVFAFLVFLLFSFFPTLTQAQQDTGHISGEVLNDRGEQLIGVNILIEGTGSGTVTDINGAFRLENITPGSYTLTFSYVGFRSKQQSVEVQAGETTVVEVSLERFFNMPQIELIGREPQRLDRVPGSAAVVSEQRIAETASVDGHEVFRQIAGIHAVGEEGLGLRANVGIRGLDPSRSRSVLMLEDGIPVALAPYGEPEMYYTPSMDRMSAVEVVKGSGSILFGPQTFGGVLNYITADPPPVATSTVQLRGGEGGFFTGKLGYGTTVGNTGVQITYLRRQGDDVGLLDFGLNDLSSKLKLVLNERSVVGIKLGYYDETSNSTYVGLTQNMFDSGRFDFTHLAPDDRLDIRRYSASVTHDFFLNESVSINTTAYGYTTSRYWSRQDFDNTFNPDRDYARIIGDESIPGGAIFFRDGTGNRNRDFEVFGIEPRISANFMLGGVANELDAGVRYLYERAFEQRVNGDLESRQSGLIRDDEVRTGNAFSAYAQNRLHINDRLSVTPGLRLEYFEYERDISRLQNENVSILNTDELVELIPGIGFNYYLREGVSFYGGVHRGFGPPRVKDAISAQGVSEELDAEKSWNYEIGTRARLHEGVRLELTGFYMDFSNQVIPVAEAAGRAGGTGTASLTNGGETQHLGLETALDIDIQQLFNTSWGANLSSSATFMRAEFSGDRFVQDGDDVVNVNGNLVPYAPGFLLSSRLNVSAPFGLGLSLTGTYTGEQFGDVLNRQEGSLNGREGKLDAFFVLDGRISYVLPQLKNASVNVSAKNLLDERYIMSRRPQGIRVGLPRFITAGLAWQF